MQPSPHAIYPANLDIRTLDNSGILMLMTIRLWVMACRYPEKACADWRNGLRQLEISEAGRTAFDSLMHILRAYSQRAMDIRCTCQQQLGSDEGWLLQIIAFTQSNRYSEARMILADWVPLPLQGMALMHVMHLAESLQYKGAVIGVGVMPAAISMLPVAYASQAAEARVLH